MVAAVPWAWKRDAKERRAGGVTTVGAVTSSGV